MFGFTSQHLGRTCVAVAVQRGDGDSAGTRDRDTLRAAGRDFDCAPAAADLRLNGHFSRASRGRPTDDGAAALRRSTDAGRGRRLTVNPRHRRDRGGLGVGGGKFGREAALVFDQALGAPVDVVVPVLADIAAQVDLLGDF